MKGINSKTKIILVVALFVIFAAGMFFFGYGILAGSNQANADIVAQKRIELEVLEREQKSFEQGKKDLADLASSSYPPDELFSRDTKVVKEIQQLEAAAQRYSLDLSIAVTGSTKTAVKVPNTSGDLYAVPYTITLDGPITNVLQFMQTAERMPFITHAKDVAISVGLAEKTTTVISSEFYVKK
jgi:hypothetical protein